MANRNSTFELIVLVILVLLTKSKFLEALRSNSHATVDFNISCIEKEREALLQFKDGLKDPSGWLSSWVGDDCCNWVGVSCSNQTGHVVTLELKGSTCDLYQENKAAYYHRSCLFGKLNPSLLNLPFLNYLDLSGNNFHGNPIPEFTGSLKNLRYLDLSQASFTGMVPSSLGNLSNLEHLDLSYNNFNSSVPQWLFNIGTFVTLKLQSCEFSGSIPKIPQGSLYNLRTLDLSSNNIAGETEEFIEFLSGFSNSILETLNLHFNELTGTLSDHKIPWGNLSKLRTLDLSNNNFGGEIKEFIKALSGCNSCNLQNLYMSYNKFGRNLPDLQVPWGSLCNLRTLDLSNNDITGEIKEFVEALSGCNNDTLWTLELGSNKLGGTLPDSLGYFKELVHLDLSDNSFLGSLPRVGNISHLTHLDLSFNLMDGMIAEDIGQLSELFTLDLYRNFWKGVMTENHFRNLSGLTFLYLSSTNKSLVFNVRHDWVAPFSLSTLATRDCQLGPAFPSWLESQVGISRLTLSSVGILDTIPSWFWRLLPQAQWLDLSDNQIRGELPKSINVHLDAWIDLGFNRLEGPLPLWSNVTNLSLRNNLLTGPIPTDIGNKMSILENLDLCRNHLNGSIPLSIRKIKNLAFFDLSNNRLSGEIPSNWQGLDKLRVVDLSKNRLFGGIPSSICSLPSLVCLRLSSNNLSGELSASLQDCTRLLSLDLGENGFFGTIQPIVEKLINVSYLGLRADMLTGNIPEQLCRFSVLRILDLARNNLSGCIPTCLGNLKAMKYTRYYSSVQPSIERIEFNRHAELVVKGRQNEYTKIISLLNIIDLSSNNLIGEIPEEITSLTVLNALNLSWNQLTGKIPENIGSLQQLETLDLSCNHLSGPIPPSMSSMTFLSHLNLSYNNLSGKILSSNQFDTWNDPSIYEGNLNLCGPPLTTNCSSGHGDSEDNDKVEDEDKSEKFWFYVSVVLGFIVGFWGVCGTLIIKESWRHTYFRFVDETKDKLFVIIAVHVGHLYKKVWRCKKVKVVANKSKNVNITSE